MSPLQAGTEDRDQEIAPSAEGQNWDFGHEASGALEFRPGSFRRA